MAKRRQDSEFELYDDDGNPISPAAAVASMPQPVRVGAAEVESAATQAAIAHIQQHEKAAPHVTTAGAGKYRVTLKCPTPLAFRTLEVEAEGEDDARAKFCAANGISGSAHDWDIVRVG